jgi:hydrogenase maturation protease
MKRVLVAGLGNVFLGDDAFGVEVVRRLGEQTLPDWVRVVDFGIRGMHLAYELMDAAYETTILVDATARGEPPGTVSLIEPDLSSAPGAAAASADPHGMSPDRVFAWLRTLGGVPGHVLLVGCEPARLEEEMGLSPVVAAAVDEAVGLVLEVLADFEEAKVWLTRTTVAREGGGR